VNNISRCNSNRNAQVTIKIGLERINIQKEIIVEVLLNSGVTELVISSKFARK